MSCEPIADIRPESGKSPKRVEEPLGPFSRGWSIASEPLAASTMKDLQGYACLHVGVKLQGCTPGATYTLGINVYGGDYPVFGGIERLASCPGTRTIDGITKDLVNEYVLLTNKAKEDTSVKFRRILPVEPGTYDVQLWVARGEVAPDKPPLVCYKAGKTFGDSQKIAVVGNGTAFQTRCHSQRMSLPPPSASAVAKSLSLRGVWEPLTTKFVKDVVKEGDVVLDLGAHIGYFTLIFAKLVGPGGRVFAFEPNPTNFAFLEKNIRLNGYTNVTLVRKAVSNATGTGRLFLGGTEDEDHLIGDSRRDCEAIDVQATRLDDYFDEYDGPTNFIRMDLEGGEPAALEGMSGLLRKNPHVRLITEFCPDALQRAGRDPVAYLKLLRDCGFSPVSHLNELFERKAKPVDLERVLTVFAPDTTLATKLYCVKPVDADDAEAKVRDVVAYEEAATRALKARAVAKALSDASPPPVRRLPGDLRDFEAKALSQSGEAGIIEEICERIGLSRGTFVEFGVGRGSECNCAHLAKEKGWRGFFIEGDQRLFEKLESNYAGHPLVTCARTWVTASNIESVFARLGVPPDFDLLSIDIDGNDYWVWKAITSYRPTLVIIEYNASYPPPIRWVMAENDQHVWDGSNYFGASLESLTALAEQKDYRLIGTTSNGVNAFFLRSDCFDESAFIAGSVEYHYSRPAYGPSFGGHPLRVGPYLEI